MRYVIQHPKTFKFASFAERSITGPESFPAALERALIFDQWMSGPYYPEVLSFVSIEEAQGFLNEVYKLHKKKFKAFRAVSDDRPPPREQLVTNDMLMLGPKDFLFTERPYKKIELAAVVYYAVHAETGFPYDGLTFNGRTGIMMGDTPLSVKHHIRINGRRGGVQAYLNSAPYVIIKRENNRDSIESYDDTPACHHFVKSWFEETEKSLREFVKIDTNSTRRAKI